MLDFDDPGDIGVYVDARVPRGARAGAARRPAPARARSSRRRSRRCAPNDLVWNYVVSNYLKGETPPAFDLLHWNGDSANLPGPMYAYYLRELYLEQPAARARRADDARRADRPVADRRAVVRRRDARRPHRAVALGVSHDRAPRRRHDVHARRVGSHRRHRQSGRAGQAQPLDQPALERRSPDDWLAGAQSGSRELVDGWSAWIAPHAGKQRRGARANRQRALSAARRRARHAMSSKRDRRRRAELRRSTRDCAKDGRRRSQRARNANERHGGGSKMAANTTRVALVTGGMGGLGEAICIKLADLGYKVVTTYSPGNTKAKEWLDGMQQVGLPVRRLSLRRHRLGQLREVREDGRRRGRPDRRAGEQRRHHARHDVQEDGQGELGRGDEDQPRLGLQHDQAGLRRHARAQLGPHHQHLVGERPEGRVRPDQLFGGEGRHARLHQGARARGRAARASPSTRSRPATSARRW